MNREQEVEKKQHQWREEHQHQEEVAAVDGWRREPQRELSQDEEWDNVESMGTEGDGKIGSAREVFEPKVGESRGSEGKMKQQ